MDTEKLLQKISSILQKDIKEIQAAEDYFELVKILLQENADKAYEYNRELLAVTGRALHNVSDIGKLGRYYDLRKKTLLVDAPVRFDSYLQYLEWDREPEKRFYLPRRKILKQVVDNMQRLTDDELDLLAISMPPGTGKSTLGIFLLTWIMGKFPAQPNLASAHSDKLTRSFYDGVLSVISDPEYLWSDVFSGINICGTNSKDETIDLQKPKRFKSLTCRSIDGSLTGATRCEKILYADDLVSGIEEALSKARMDTLWEKYTNDLKSRKKQGCKEVHIATRWSVHDPIGRLQRQYDDDPKAKFIAIPAVDENDESNFDYAGGVGFDTKYFMDMKNSLDDVSWRCLFKNEPIERKGLLYHDTELRRYFELPDREPDAIIGICDTKDKGTDYAFLPTAYVYGNDYYIDDCVCDNGNPTIVEIRLAEILVRHKVAMCRFESNSSGGKISESVQDRVKELGGATHITTRYTTENKETKIIVNSTWVKEHCLFRDKSVYPASGDYKRMMEFLCGWTMAGKNANDDVPDGMAMLAQFAQGMNSVRVEIFQRMF